MSLTTDRTSFQAIFQQVSSGSAALTPGSLTAGTVSTANTVACPGAALGDIVFVSAPAAIGATIMWGEVTAVNVVTIKFLSGATTAPPTGVYKVASLPFTAAVV